MKKIVRLTEGDLHRIIKESVERIINEAQLNELDPRTYASYAQKRAAQGQHDKAGKGVATATNAWNKKYNYSGNVNPDGSWKKDKGMGLTFDTERYIVDDNDSFFNPDKTQGTHKFNRYEFYTDKNKPTSHGSWGVSWKNDDAQPYEDEVKYYTDDDINSLNDEGLKVAQQMAKGNGKYIKGKGWQ